MTVYAVIKNLRNLRVRYPIMNVFDKKNTNFRCFCYEQTCQEQIEGDTFLTLIIIMSQEEKKRDCVVGCSLKFAHSSAQLTITQVECNDKRTGKCNNALICVLASPKYIEFPINT